MEPSTIVYGYNEYPCVSHCVVLKACQAEALLSDGSGRTFVLEEKNARIRSLIISVAPCTPTRCIEDMAHDLQVEIDEHQGWTEMDAFNASSYYKKDAEITFGTGSRPPLYAPGGGPGPGAYPIKSTMFKLLESDKRSPSAFSMRSRQEFGDPNAASMSKTAAAEPGPGSYDLGGKFISGRDPRPIKFSKSIPQVEKSGLAPGPGAYGAAASMGKQVLSTKPANAIVKFGSAERQGMAVKGASDVGPGEYGAPRGACDVQVTSNKPTCGSIKIGTGYSKKGKLVRGDFSEPSPGPGAYKTLGGVGTRAKGTIYRNSPAATMSGRNKFGSPW